MACSSAVPSRSGAQLLIGTRPGFVTRGRGVALAVIGLLVVDMAAGPPAGVAGGDIVPPID